MHIIIAIVLCALSAIVDIIGLAIPYWCYVSGEGGSSYFGLWKSCLPVGGNSVCFSLTTGTGTIAGTRALEILGMLLLFAALATALLKQFVLKDKPIILKIGAACAILGGVLMIVGTIVFATDSTLKFMRTSAGMKLHAGFALCIVAGIFAFPAGVVMLLNKT